MIFNYYYRHEFVFSGWCVWLFLITTYHYEYVFGWRARLIFNYYYYYWFCLFRVACPVIFYHCEFCFSWWRARLSFNNYYYHELCFPGWCARLFLITTTITSCFPGCVHGYFKNIITVANFVFFSRGVRVSFLMTTTSVCLALFGWCARLFYLVLRSRVFEWRARSFFNYYYYCEFCF